MTAVESRPAGVVLTPSPGGHRPFGARVKAYVALTKPRIIELLLITTVPVMFLAEQGVPNLWLVLATCFGGYLSAGGANALNMYIDRDIDALMDRTSQRPLVTGVLTPREGLVFGLSLAVISTLWFGLLVNWLSAALSLGALLFYVVVYTMILKRRTAQNIVWGGIAGCFPTLIGWTAVTNELAWTPVVLFLVVFFWTPPHTWSLAMRYREDYASVDVPMLPVVATPVATARQIMAYSVIMVITSIALWPVADTGFVYPLAAIALGVVFLREARALLLRAHTGAEGAALRPMRLFHFSNIYLALLFIAAAVDPLLH